MNKMTSTHPRVWNKEPLYYEKVSKSGERCASRQNNTSSVVARINSSKITVSLL